MLAITFPIVMGVLLIAPRFAVACTCEGTVKAQAEQRKYIAREVNRSTAVFLGEVIAVDTFKAVLKVKKVWRGDLGSEAVMSTGSFDYGNGSILTNSCIIDSWEVGKQYVVFADQHLGARDLLRAEKCGPTTTMPYGQRTTAILDKIFPAESPSK